LCGLGVNPFLVTATPQNPGYGAFSTQPMNVGATPSNMSVGGFSAPNNTAPFQVTLCVVCVTRLELCFLHLLR